MEPVIITCAITGAETTRERQPHLPITPREQAQASAECLLAGASIIHLHVREDDGKPSQRVERFADATTQIRAAAPGIVMQFSTGGAVGESAENRARPLSLKPEMASLNIGSMNFGDDVFWNHPKEVAGLAERMRALGIVPELEVYEVGMLEAAYALVKKGVLSGPLHFQFVLGVPGGMSGEPGHLVFLLERMRTLHRVAGLSSEPSWGVAGVGRYQLPLAVEALMMGGNVRVGFEDNIFYSRGVVATSNAQLVERIVRIARELGREVATPAQTRTILGLK